MRGFKSHSAHVFALNVPVFSLSWKLTLSNQTLAFTCRIRVSISREDVGPFTWAFWSSSSVAPSMASPPTPLCSKVFLLYFSVPRPHSGLCQIPYLFWFTTRPAPLHPERGDPHRHLRQHRTVRVPVACSFFNAILIPPPTSHNSYVGFLIGKLLGGMMA